MHRLGIISRMDELWSYLEQHLCSMWGDKWLLHVATTAFPHMKGSNKKGIILDDGWYYIKDGLHLSWGTLARSWLGEEMIGTLSGCW